MMRPSKSKMRALIAERGLPGKELFPDVAKCLELDRVSGRIEKEHGGLFARFALEANVRFNCERDARRAKLVGEHIELRQFEHGAEMRDRHVMAVDHVCGVASFSARVVFRQVTDQLMA